MSHSSIISSLIPAQEVGQKTEDWFGPFWKSYHTCSFVLPLSFVVVATSRSPDQLVLSWGAALIVESSAASGSLQNGNGWLLDSPRGRVCISLSFRNRLDIRFHQDCQGNTEQKSCPRSTQPRDTLHARPPAPSWAHAGITNQPRHPPLKSRVSL